MRISDFRSRLSLLAAGALALAACRDAEAPAAPPLAPAPEASAVLSGDALLARFPEAVGPYSLQTSSTDLDGALGVQVTRATARYALDASGPSVTVGLLDLGTSEMARNMGYGWGTEADTTRSESFEGYPAQSEATDRPQTTVLRVLVGRRFLIEVTGEGVGRDRVGEAVRALDLRGLAAEAAQ